MKKYFAIVAMVATFALAFTANAQKVYELTGVEKVGNGFVAKAGTETLPINPYLYKRVKAAPADYVLVVYNGENASAKTLALRSKVDYAVMAVDSIGYDEAADVAEVFLSDKSVYRSSNEDWLKVLKGQHVERWLIDGETKIMEHFRTVPRDVALTTTIPISAAPTVTTPAPTTATTATVTTMATTASASDMALQQRPPMPPAPPTTATATTMTTTASTTNVAMTPVATKPAIRIVKR